MKKPTWANRLEQIVSDVVAEDEIWKRFRQIIHYSAIPRQLYVDADGFSVGDSQYQEDRHQVDEIQARILHGEFRVLDLPRVMRLLPLSFLRGLKIWLEQDSEDACQRFEQQTSKTAARPVRPAD